MCAETVNAVDIAMKHLDQALDVYDPSSMASMMNVVSCASAAVSVYFGETIIEPSYMDIPDGELPGMWERSDFTGGETDNES